MMAGVVAMASVIEDFDTQPCKKSRKDGGSPVVKTITNYFSPLPKPPEKPVSPTRSNNIMDYFIRKAPSFKGNTSSPEQLKDQYQGFQLDNKGIIPDGSAKQYSQKRRRKTSKTAQKVVEAETVTATDEDSCFIVEGTSDDRDSAAEAVGSCSTLGSDTAALLVQLCPEACVTEGIVVSNASNTVSKKDEYNENGENDVKLKPGLIGIELSPILPSKGKQKQGRTVVKNSRKKQQLKTKLSGPDEDETAKALCDVSMEVNVDETSRLNNSTVTISFEDFVRSQSQDMDEENGEDESKITSDVEEVDSDQSTTPKAKQHIGSEEAPLQVSPRTVTIQAEVHTAAPKKDVKVVENVASIFNRRKTVGSPAEVESSVETGQQQPPSSFTAKRKSNVVLQEEDLELAVLDSESTVKCSGAEKKQFMAAFKQASLSGSKTKISKSQGNQKEPEGKDLDDDKIPVENALIPSSTEQTSDASTDHQIAKKKPIRKSRKATKAQKEEVLTPPAAALVEEKVLMIVVVDDEKEEPPITSTPSIPTLRSTRGAAVKPAAEATPAASVRKTRKHRESKDAAIASKNDSPAEMSSTKLRRSKHGVFIAEMVNPPDMKESPIRIKFTRVHKNFRVSNDESESVTNSLTTAVTNNSKKRKQAKKLVEKARMIQKSKKAAVEVKGSLRCSSRAKASARKSYCEDEDSIVCLEDIQPATGAASAKGKSQKSLRSLNDVLGKSSPVGKDARPVSGSKVTLQDKAAWKASKVISVFDDSSREGSENSQDNEQFRARREFLKSGLPESFRKQITKTAATKEAYSLSCSSFQPVVHVKQPPKDCPLWSLLWPKSSLLSHLKEFRCRTFDSPFLCGSFHMKTELTPRTIHKQDCSWRPEISESVRQRLTDEVSTSNPAFPAQMFATRLLNRQADHQHQCTATEPEALTSLAAEPMGGKRKRMSDEGEMSVKLAKKQRAVSSEENIRTVEPEPTRRGGRTRRGRISCLEEEGGNKTKSSVKAAPIPPEDDCVVLLKEDAGRNVCSTDMVKGDMLWTDKYQPQHSSDIIGNAASVRKLHSWLKEWKLRADRDERKKQKYKKQEEESNDSDWDCGEEDFQDGEDMLRNTLLITGPTGVGKTAAVYACAQELGFTVFEVNASSQRSGRLILSQLKEATQSHQVDSQGVNTHKPSYFNSYGTNSSSAGSLRPTSSPRKVKSPRRVVSFPRKHPQSPRGTKRGGLTPTSLANFFKISQPSNKDTVSTKKNEQTAASKNARKAGEVGSKNKQPAVKAPAATGPRGNEEQNKKTATSLILFEEVDVIFDDDSGFLAAIKTFMTTTKRPVILTTSDPAFSTMFDGNFEEIHFKAPAVADAGCFLRLLCLAEDLRTDQQDINSLLRLTRCDMRQSLLQLQFWACSGGGRDTTKNKSEEVASSSDATPALPPCDTRCTESMLGLLNIEPDRDVWELLKSRRPVEDHLCWELLANSRWRGMDLLYSNLEMLLSLPLSQLTSSTHRLLQGVSVSQDQLPVHPKEMPSHTSSLRAETDCSDDGSPVKMSSRMRKTKGQHSASDQYALQSDSDSEDSFLSLCKPRGVPQTKEEAKESLPPKTVKRRPLTPEEHQKRLPISQCLESIAEFLDDMSYVDSSLLACGQKGISLVVKDGMTDETCVEIDRQSFMREEHTLEMQAAVEALSFCKCRVSVVNAWDKSQQLDVELGKEAAAELTLPVAAHRVGCSFTQDGTCHPQLVEQRREVMERLMLRGVFGTLGNKPAAAVDYMPALRTICRSEQLKEQGKLKRRFLHYLDAIHLGLEKSTLQHLAEDFP
ncbi:ATPase family AAA domain-containing protein 5 isoform X2 [Antennarius striatus]|uniref:ATPase family AAA domain-containing protein 5 isoform X2 n=1 Tax=Antennarius striatus TaxID=241820 RepID=UPI0035B20C1D